MNRAVVAIVSGILLAVVVIISIVLIDSFHGNDTQILVAAIIGFATPVIGTCLVLAQSVVNGEKVQAVDNKVTDVNSKVNGHLAALTRLVVDHAASGTPIDAETAAELASRTSDLTGQVIAFVPPTPPIAPGELKIAQDEHLPPPATRGNP